MNVSKYKEFRFLTEFEYLCTIQLFFPLAVFATLQPQKMSTVNTCIFNQCIGEEDAVLRKCKDGKCSK